MYRIILLLGLLSPSLVAQAQVYKCVENGKTVFSGIPCSADAKAVNATPAMGDFDPAAAARVNSETAAIKAKLAAQDAERTAARQAAAARVESSRSAEQDRCANIRAKKNDAEYWAREFRHPDNIAREQAKAEHWKERLWWECKQVK